MPRSKATVSKFQVRAIPSRLVSEEKATDDISIPVPVPLYLRLLKMLALAALLTVIAAPSLLPRFSVVDNDLWGHLKVGDWIVEHRSFPHTGILSDTARDRPWMAYSWIDEVVLSFFHSRFSLVGISIYGTHRVAGETRVERGASLAGPVLEIGNTNSRYRFPIGARNFMNEWNVHGSAHLCAAGVVHIAGKLKKLGALTGVECIRVC